MYYYVCVKVFVIMTIGKGIEERENRKEEREERK
jgi:hypothetical protein